VTARTSQQGFSRRRFLLGVVGVAGGGLALTWASREPESLATAPDTLEPNAFLQITPDGRFVFQLDKAELGQGVMTGLKALMEQSGIDPAQVTQLLHGTTTATNALAEQSAIGNPTPIDMVIRDRRIYLQQCNSIIIRALQRKLGKKKAERSKIYVLFAVVAGSVGVHT